MHFLLTSLSLALPTCVILFEFFQLTNPVVISNLTVAAIIAVFGFFSTNALLPALEGYLFRRGLKGKDLGRKGRPDEDEEIPSAVGVIVGIVFLTMVIVMQAFTAKTIESLVSYNAALQSMCFMLLLGFIDDVVDLPWRYKCLLPPIGSLPLLCSYNGVTTVSMPIFARALIWDGKEQTMTLLGEVLQWIGMTIDPKGQGSFVDVGYYYFIYMSMLSVFCTNSINIYAGINGLEVGQSIVVAVAILITNLYQLQWCEDQTHPHLISAMILICFIAVSLALLRHNWFPARCFVGDTYCYFAGVTFAVVGILGHFSKTLLLYLLPQIINFLYSCPQLFKIYPCPRHRLPGVDANGLRVPSTFAIPDPSNPSKVIVKDNMTLINLVLKFTGPIREETLTYILLLLQAIVCTIGFVSRYYAAEVLYGTEAAAIIPH